MLRKLKLTCQLFLLLAAVQGIWGDDFYSSVSGMENLVETEMYLVQTFEHYLNRVQETNELIIDFLDKAENNLMDIGEDPETFFGNPINSFKTLSRLAIGWKRLEKTIMADRDYKEFAKNVSNAAAHGYMVAQNEDLEGASRGILTLQDIYQLSAEDISQGVLQDYVYKTNLSASDCYHLGRTLYHQNEYKRAGEWLLQARAILRKTLKGEKIDNEIPEFPHITEVQILEYLAPTVYSSGNRKMAIILNRELLALDRDNTYGLQNIELYENGLKEERMMRYGMIAEEPAQEPKSIVKDLYAKVCRGELRQTPREQRKLRCRYYSNNKPYRLIGPFKMEELSHDPFAAVFHDVISFEEMEKIINKTQEHIQRSKVGDLTTSRVSDIRTSKNTWLYYHEQEFLPSIGRRLQDITNLSLVSAEPLQVANYGLGGQYGPHFDFSEDPDNTYAGKGNRILTALFYINDVELGGATAFPFLRIAVPPERGSLLVWYNMHESLELDYRTKHAACPVIKGSKWICNQWFHQIGQEFIRPCSLGMNGNVSIEYRNVI